MGKYKRKSSSRVPELALMEVSQSIGVLTRAKTLALQRLHKSPPTAAVSGGSYLQLRSRRLHKSTIIVASGNSKRRKHKGRCVRNPNSRVSSRLRVGSVNSGSAGSVSRDCMGKREGCLVRKEEGIEEGNGGDLGIEASFGENVLDFEGRERSTRETTPCSLIRETDTIRTPGSATRPNRSTEAKGGKQNSLRRHVPTTSEMDEFFAREEEEERKQFIEKYNFDPLNERPLPGRYEWVKLDP